MNANRELILVTGGSGGLGRRVVSRLVARGLSVRVLSRRQHDSVNGVDYVVGDLETNVGVVAAAAGCTTIVHCAGVGKIKEDTAQATNLARAARETGVRHIVSVSVVGAERVPVKSAIDRSMFAYFASQRAKELAIEASGVPWSNLRAAQFHDGFILVMVRAMAKMPVIPLPAQTRFQPIDGDEVADALVDIALHEPIGQAPDMAGPKIYEAEYLVRSYLRAIGKSRPIVKFKAPGAAAAAIRGGANLSPDQAVGRRTWEDFLDERFAQVSASGISASPM